MSELRSIILGIGHGLKDSLFGMTALLRISSILGENLPENQLKADSQSSFRRPRHRARTSLDASEKKADRLDVLCTSNRFKYGLNWKNFIYHMSRFRC